jgi:transposase-like protein
MEMNKKPSNKFSHEIRARAVRMVQEHRVDHASQWAAIASIAAKIGCSGETLRNWVRQAERDAGVRPGATTDEREGSRRWSGRIASFGRPMRFCARRRLILPRRSSTAGSSHDRLHRRSS